jgi:hypothetical protein
MIGLDIIPPLMTVGAVLAALWQSRQAHHQAFCEEMKRLEWAADAAREHGKALDRFMYLAGVSDQLKSFLLDASDALEGREFVHTMAKMVKSGFSAESEVTGQANEIWNQVAQLAANNVEAYDVFVQALFSGIAAALLRWPDTAPVLSRPLVPTQDNIRREVVVTARAVRENASYWSSKGLLPAS